MRIQVDNTPTKMSEIHSFLPIADVSARILVLGSMPGKESLRAQQYYAHPRNSFWMIMGELFGALPTLPYESRTEILKAAGVAVWDVLASCTRDGSLDSDIDKTSIVANDFSTFFRNHTQISAVFFNGTMAEHCFARHVLPQLTSQPLHFQRLPSTSPANAAVRYETKREAWAAIEKRT